MTAAGALLLWMAIGVAQTPEDSLRAAVTDYYAALEQEDLERVLAFWAPGAERAPDRPSLVTLFTTGDDRYVVTITRAAVDGDRGRVRVIVDRARTLIREGVAVQTYSSRAASSLMWTRGADGGWKLTAERPVAEEVADALLQAAPADRAKVLADNGDAVDAALMRALASRGSRFAMANQPRQSEAAFDAALFVARAAHDRTAEIEALQNLANAHYFQRHYEQAQEYYQQRLALAREMNDEPAIATSELGIATAMYSRAEYSAALTYYRSALARFEAAGLGPSVATTRISVGNVQYVQAEYDAAAASYRRALKTLESSADAGSETLALAGLGRVYAAQGDLGAALDAYGRVLDSARRRADTASIATTLESVGELHYRLGNSGLARGAFDESRRIVEAQGDVGGAGRLLQNIGLTELVAGRFDAALAAYTASRARYEKAQDPAGVAHAWVGIGFSQTAREKYADAIDAYKTAIAAFDTLRREEDGGRARLGLALAQAGAEQFAASLETAARVRSIADRLVNDDLRWRAAVAQGDALRGLKRPDEALAAYDDAADGIHTLLSEAPLSSDAQSQLDDLGSAWAGRAAAYADKGDGRAALLAEEQRRSEMRRLVLAAHERDIVRGAAQAETDEERQTVRDIISLRAQARAAGATGDKARLERLKPSLTAAMNRRADQQSRLYARVPALQTLRGLGPPAAAADLDALVADPRTLLVEYAIYDTGVAVFIAERGEAAVRVSVVRSSIRRKELVDRVNDAIDPASLHDAAEWARRSAPLVQALLGPVLSRLADHDRLLIVPDDVLWKIPFEALPAGDVALIERAAVVYAPSLGTLIQQNRVREQNRPKPDAAVPATPRFGGIAAPDIPAAVTSQLTRTVPGWTPLDAAAALITGQRSAAAYGEEGGTLATDAAATEKGARGLAATVDVLQIGAPMHVSGASPLFSSILLSASPDTEASDTASLENDGRWEAREWFALDARARTVVVTDGSAFAAPGAGRAMDALGWAWMAAGVASGVTARGASEAYDLDATLTGFHDRVAHGAADYADALRAAMLAAKHENAAPAAWAGLRFIGAGW